MPRSHRRTDVAHSYWAHSAPFGIQTAPAVHRSSTPCAGPCNRDWRDAEDRRCRDGQPHEIQPTFGAPLWCPKCVDRFSDAALEMPRLTVEIHNQAIYGTGVASQRTGKHPKLAVAAWPGQSARLLIEEIRDALLSLEDDVRQLRGFNARPNRGREGPTIVSSACFVARNADWICEHHPISDDPLDAPGSYLIRLHARAVRFIGGGRALAELKVTPCPSCGCLSLAQQIGGRFIECGMPDCGRCLTRDEYDQYTKMEAAYQGARQAFLAEDAGGHDAPACVPGHHA